MAKPQLPAGGFHGGDIYAYRWLAGRLPYDGAMVELGSYAGRSICSISHILIERRVSTTLVDSFVGLPPDPKVTEVVTGVQYEDAHALEAKLRRSIAAFNLDARVIVGDSASAAALFADDSLDMVFIDADHQYDSVLRDLAAWWPKIRWDGRIAGHDYTAELRRPNAAGHFGTSGGYHVAPALRTFFKMEREIKRVPRQQQTTVWYVEKNPQDDLVVQVNASSPNGDKLRARGERVLEVARQLRSPTKESLIYRLAEDPVMSCHLPSAGGYVSRLLRSGHLMLRPRSGVS